MDARLIISIAVLSILGLIAIVQLVLCFIGALVHKDELLWFGVFMWAIAAFAIAWEISTRLPS